MSIIVATGVYALLLKFLQKNSPHNVQTKGGGGAKGFLKILKKLHFFLQDGFPKQPKVSWKGKLSRPDLGELIKLNFSMLSDL